MRPPTSSPPVVRHLFRFNVKGQGFVLYAQRGDGYHAVPLDYASREVPRAYLRAQRLIDEFIERRPNRWGVSCVHDAAAGISCLAYGVSLNAPDDLGRTGIAFVHGMLLSDPTKAREALSGVLAMLAPQNIGECHAEIARMAASGGDSNLFCNRWAGIVLDGIRAAGHTASPATWSRHRISSVYHDITGAAPLAWIYLAAQQSAHTIHQSWEFADSADGGDRSTATKLKPPMGRSVDASELVAGLVDEAPASGSNSTEASEGHYANPRLIGDNLGTSTKESLHTPQKALPEEAMVVERPRPAGKHSASPRVRPMVIGHHVGPVGRIGRIVVGFLGIAWLMWRLPLWPEPDTLRADAIAGWLLLLILAYSTAYKIIAALPRLQQGWIAAGILLGPPALVYLLELGPPAYHDAFFLYFAASLVLNGFLAYGGSEVLAFPTMLGSRRHVAYTPSNAIDAVERASPSVGVVSWRGWTMVLLVLAAALLAYHFILDSTALFAWLSAPEFLSRRAGALVLLMAGYFFWRSWAAYRAAQGGVNGTRSNVVAALALVAVAATFAVGDIWKVWGAIMVLGLAATIANQVRRARDDDVAGRLA